MSLHAALAFGQTLAWQRRRSRTRFERWQADRLNLWLNKAARRVPEYAKIDPEQGLQALPVIGKSDLLDRFEQFNRLSLTRAQAMRMADGVPPPAGYFVGASTGTTGPRQPYLISEAERQVWLGTILAKTLGLAALRRPRVAVILPRGSALYDAAARRLPLKILAIGDGFASVTEDVARFRPDILVAPPRLLRWLAEHRPDLAPKRVYAAAEVLDPVDRDAIRTGFPEAQLGEIYMATEGLLAVTCGHGMLHLAEDRMHFEFEDVAPGCVTPIITDFSRTTQIMARYRLNDVLRLGAPCSCGSVLRTVAEVQGRCDDLFVLGGVPVTPDVVRDAVLSCGEIRDFRVRQTGPRLVEVHLGPGAPSVAARVLAAIRRAGGDADVTEHFAPIHPPVDRKLRRVERVWKED